MKNGVITGAQMKPTVYLETSVISYYTSRPSRDIVVTAHQQLTREWWEKAAGQFEVVISEAVVDEVALGDSEASARRLESVETFKVLPLTSRIQELTQILLKELEIPKNAFPDAAHLAFASHYKIVYLVSWNCRHIASGRIIKRLNELHAKTGIHVPVICTPNELLEDYPWKIP